MKSKKWIMLAAAIMRGLLLCACDTGNPSETGKGADANAASVWYNAIK